MRKLLMVGLVLVMILGMAALVAPTDVMAKGKPQPPPCQCAPTVGPCVLVDCGFDCVYSCPFPLP